MLSITALDCALDCVQAVQDCVPGQDAMAALRFGLTPLYPGFADVWNDIAEVSGGHSCP